MCMAGSKIFTADSRQQGSAVFQKYTVDQRLVPDHDMLPRVTLLGCMLSPQPFLIQLPTPQTP